MTLMEQKTHMFLALGWWFCRCRHMISLPVHGLFAQLGVETFRPESDFVLHLHLSTWSRPPDSVILFASAFSTEQTGFIKFNIVSQAGITITMKFNHTTWVCLFEGGIREQHIRSICFFPPSPRIHVRQHFPINNPLAFGCVSIWLCVYVCTRMRSPREMCVCVFGWVTCRIWLGYSHHRERSVAGCYTIAQPTPFKSLITSFPYIQLSGNHHLSQCCENLRTHACNLFESALINASVCVRVCLSIAQLASVGDGGWIITIGLRCHWSSIISHFQRANHCPTGI